MLEQAAFSRVSGIDPIELVLGYLRPTLVVMSLLAFYALARTLLKSETAALLAGSLYALFFLIQLDPTLGSFGREFVGRVAEDKFAARFLILPVTLVFAFLFFESRRLRYLAVFAFLCWAVVAIHTVGLAIIGLSTAGFGLANLAVNWREKGAWIRTAALFDEAGRAYRFIGTVLDITERRRTEEVQTFLAEASKVLSSSLSYRTTLSSVARLAVPILADWCAVDVLEEDGSVERLAVEHEDVEKVALALKFQERYPPDPEAPGRVPNVLKSGRPEFYPEITEEMLEAAARDEEHLRLLREIGFTSVIIVPMTTRGRTLGAITLVSSESGRRFGEADLELAEELGHRAALAVDNARLYEEELRRRSPSASGPRRSCVARGMSWRSSWEGSPTA